ncbi:hypothetical protein K8O93_00750 [Gordonia bronchialis]|uniref:hypothetical protein n=1 Tax=Gordonia bronchialis TaxID=2054 RepID=UPI001CC11C41|nr:hypothetical protein [Gordonia bronchialis]UAK38362.1 hypothetical protein K8O93_00750 [Gordonia bronchialis]
MSQPTIVVTPDLRQAARWVLWFFNGSNEGERATRPGGFYEQLIVTMCKADPTNLSRLYLAFPEVAQCVSMAKYAVDGLERLREWAA